MKFFKQKYNKGTSLIELVFYIALFAMLSLVVINAMVSMTRAFKETKIQSEFMQGSDMMDRISREIRQSYDINSISSTSLKLNTKDASGTNKTVRFTLSGTDIQFYDTDDTTPVGNLNSPTTSVSSLSFTQVTTTAGKGVKVTLTITSTSDSQARTQDFYNTIVLRGAY